MSNASSFSRLSRLTSTLRSRSGAEDRLVTSAAEGNENVLERWLPFVTSDDIKDQAIDFAARNGHLGCVEKVLETRENKKAKSLDRALYGASTMGFHDIVKTLSPLSVSYEDALKVASENGHKACLEVLIETYMLHQINAQNIALAAANGHEDVVHFLLPYCNVKQGFILCMYQREWEGAELLSRHLSMENLEQTLHRFDTKEPVLTRARLASLKMETTLKGTLGQALNPPIEKRL